jgi:nucleoid-associated protein YgaU
MGLFSFFKKSGSKKLEEAEKAAASAAADAEAVRQQKIKALYDEVNEYGLDVKDLKIDLNDDTVIVEGEVEKQSTKELLVLTLGNIDGIATVDDRVVVSNPEPEAVFYEVKSGDSLSKIALAQYGDAQKYTQIFEANKPMLKDPNKIYPGQMLRIPPMD